MEVSIETSMFYLTKKPAKYLSALAICQGLWCMIRRNFSTKINKVILKNNWPLEKNANDTSRWRRNCWQVTIARNYSWIWNRKEKDAIINVKNYYKQYGTTTKNLNQTCMYLSNKIKLMYLSMYLFIQKTVQHWHEVSLIVDFSWSLREQQFVSNSTFELNLMKWKCTQSM